MSPGPKILLALGATVVVLVLATIALNRAPLLAAPGPAARLWLYLTTHVAATSPDSPRPELRTRRYSADAQALRAVIVDGIRAMGWEVSDDAAGGGPVRAVVVSALFRFRDDVEIQVTADGTGAVVDIVSRSRVGRGDFGANVRHVLDVHAKIAEKLGPGTRLESAD